VLAFQSQREWEDFQKWPDYWAFLAEIAPYLETSPHVEALTGLESWFTPIGSPVLARPSRWKMALVTWIGVCFTVYVVNTVFAAVVPAWPRFVTFLFANAVIVAGLTWAVMPVLNRIFQGWLTQSESRVAD
jgi:antibiotic biosynthesis monooxygenase (ABM) superfamily enzyme